MAATIGKYIHPGGAFSAAREELQNKMVKPYSTDGNGKDTLIYAHTPSVNPQKVEDVFFELQKWHRQNERELNRMKFAIKKQAEKKTLEDIQQFKQALEQEKQRHMQLFSQYKNCHFPYFRDFQRNAFIISVRCTIIPISVDYSSVFP